MATLDEIIASLPDDERTNIEARAAELILEEMSLRKLRKSIGKTQSMLAERLKVGQDAVSKVEMRRDMRISTLRDFIGAMGGQLDLIARFDGHRAVRLEGLGKPEPRRKRRQKAASVSHT